MDRRLIECVPNFSEGRDIRVVDEIVDAIAATPGVVVLARESDPDHNRSVVTFAGTPEAVAAGAVRGIEQAVRRIDLARHEGVHPRIGAADVVPFIPVSGVSLEECVEIAHRVGRRVWDLLRVPVYFYEAAALTPERARLENVRRRGFRWLLHHAAEHRPDIGDPVLHATAGAVAIGARKFLIAFNANLTTADVGIAQTIARKIRSSSGGLPALKAIGVPIESRGLAQVSMNLTDFEQTGLFAAFIAAQNEAALHGAAIASTEIIGLVPRKALDHAAARFLKCENCTENRILENRIEAALPGGPMRELLDQIARPASPAGGGSAAALAGAMAASLGYFAAHASGLACDHFLEHRAFFAGAVERDASAFNEALVARKAADETRPGALEEALKSAATVPAETTERARLLDRDLQRISEQIAAKFRSDLITALALARAARAGARATAKANLAAIDDAGFRRQIEGRISRRTQDV